MPASAVPCPCICTSHSNPHPTGRWLTSLASPQPVATCRFSPSTSPPSGFLGETVASVAPCSWKPPHGLLRQGRANDGDDETMRQRAGNAHAQVCRKLLATSRLNSPVSVFSRKRGHRGRTGQGPLHLWCYRRAFGVFIAQYFCQAFSVLLQAFRDLLLQPEPIHVVKKTLHH